MSEKKLSHGHRARLKERFLNSPLRTLPDYEILEMILFSIFPRKDTKSIAKTLLSEFGSLAGVINAEPTKLKAISGIGDSVGVQFKLLLDFFSRLHIPTQPGTEVLSNWHSVINYCQLTMGHTANENFRVIYLNKKNALVGDEISESGTIDKIHIYPREIAKRALHYNASSVILVHNHPSGDISPSEEDIRITQQVIKALSPLEITIHDHLIIGRSSHYSFRMSGLI